MVTGKVELKMIFRRLAYSCIPPQSPHPWRTSFTRQGKTNFHILILRCCKQLRPARPNIRDMTAWNYSKIVQVYIRLRLESSIRVLKTLPGMFIQRIRKEGKTVSVKPTSRNGATLHSSIVIHFPGKTNHQRWFVMTL